MIVQSPSENFPIPNLHLGYCFRWIPTLLLLAVKVFQFFFDIFKLFSLSSSKSTNFNFSNLRSSWFNEASQHLCHPRNEVFLSTQFFLKHSKLPFSLFIKKVVHSWTRQSWFPFSCFFFQRYIEGKRPFLFCFHKTWRLLWLFSLDLKCLRNIRTKKEKDLNFLKFKCVQSCTQCYFDRTESEWNWYICNHPWRSWFATIRIKELIANYSFSQGIS